jgi:hypothetical protein
MNEDIIDTLRQEYMALAHAMQTGVKMLLQYDQDIADPKHVRVGINSAMVNDAALARLLMEKGVFTEIEYHRAVRDAMRREVQDYEADLSQRLGRKVTLL